MIATFIILSPIILVILILIIKMIFRIDNVRKYNRERIVFLDQQKQDYTDYQFGLIATYGQDGEGHNGVKE